MKKNKTKVKVKNKKKDAILMGITLVAFILAIVIYSDTYNAFNKEAENDFAERVRQFDTSNFTM